MRKSVILMLLILALLTGTANAEAPESGGQPSDLAGTYLYEGEGFGGDFTITLNADGTYAFYEGPLSSYMGGGAWNVDGEAVHLTEENGFELQFTFEVLDDVLVYDAAASDAFPYVEVSDAARFVRQDAAEEGTL